MMSSGGRASGWDDDVINENKVENTINLLEILLKSFIS